MPASVLTDVFYIGRKKLGLDKARTAIQQCLEWFTIITVDRAILEAAFALPGGDFEDNVQIACAQSAGLDLIVTRDADGFRHSPIPAIAPQDIVTHLAP